MILRLPRWPLVRRVPPVVFALYRKPADCDKTHPFRTRRQLAAELVQQAAKALPEVQWRVSADGPYANRYKVAGLPENANLVSRIRRNPAVYTYRVSPGIVRAARHEAEPCEPPPEGPVRWPARCAKLANRPAHE